MINIAIIWALIILFIIQPGIAHDGAEFGAYLFIHALLPYLLPYIILTQWLLNMPVSVKKKSPWKRFIKAYILGSFGGFPVGAVTVSEMAKKGELTKRQAGILLAACHAPGPMFIIGFVGIELFKDVAIGWKLLIAIHLANLLFFIVALFFLKIEDVDSSENSLQKVKPTEMPLLQAIKDSSNVIILVATTVIFFSSLGTVLSSTLSSMFDFELGLTKVITLSIFEMTSGVQAATDLFSSLQIFPLLVAFIISLNGFSIHIQVAVIAKAAKVSLKPYLLGRLWSISLVPIIFYLLLL